VSLRARWVTLRARWVTLRDPHLSEHGWMRALKLSTSSSRSMAATAGATRFLRDTLAPPCVLAAASGHRDVAEDERLSESDGARLRHGTTGLASPSELLASPSELLASPSELLASPSELLASPSELSASPSELLACHPASSQRHPASS
jgi:hypothetical protein